MMIANEDIINIGQIKVYSVYMYRIDTFDSAWAARKWVVKGSTLPYHRMIQIIMIQNNDNDYY